MKSDKVSDYELQFGIDDEWWPISKIVGRAKELGMKLSICLDVDDIVNETFLPFRTRVIKKSFLPESHHEVSDEQLKEQFNFTSDFSCVEGRFTEIIKRDFMRQLRALWFPEEENLSNDNKD